MASNLSGGSSPATRLTRRIATTPSVLGRPLDGKGGSGPYRCGMARATLQDYVMVLCGARYAKIYC